MIRVRLSLLLLLGITTTNAAHATALSLQGRVANPELVRRYFGTTDKVAVWLSDMSEGRVVSRALLGPEGRTFTLQLPDTLGRHVRPYEICDGPTMTPSGVRTYTPETLMLYHRSLNRALGPVVQTDDPRDPTKSTTYIYSDRAARIQGRCTNLNQQYDLTLRPGWNPVTTTSRVTRTGNTLFIARATENLPFWVTDSLKFDKVDRVLPASFFQTSQERTSSAPRR